MSARRGARRGPVDQPHLLDEAAVGVGEADEARGRAARGERAREALDQPGAERVEPFEPGEIDVDPAGGLVTARGLLNDRFEGDRGVGRPGAGGGKGHAVALDPAGDRSGAQGTALPANRDAAGDP